MMMTSKRFDTVLTLPTDREICVTRTFAAPRARVWQMWTQAEHIAKWWGPTGWTVPVCEVDLRPGGEWFYCMRSPEGQDYCGKAVYHEIIELEQLVYTDYFTDTDGVIAEDMPAGRVTLTFSADPDGTTVTSTTLYPTTEARDAVIEMGVEEGIKQTYDRLVEELGKLQA